MNDSEVVIVGAGPAGAATALALSRLGVTSTLLDRGDGRTCVGETLPPAIKKSLAELGVWERFVAANHSPAFGTRARWGRSAATDTDFMFSPYGAGWHVDRARFNEMLIEAAHEAGVITLRPASVLCLESNTGGGWRVAVRHEDRDGTLAPRVVVDASGRSGSLARRLGVQRILDDRLVAAVGFYAPVECAPTGRRVREQLTLIESVENGWWYSALQPDGHIVVAYLTDADLLPDGLRKRPDAWQREIDRTTDMGARVEGHALTAQPIVVPAFSACASPASGTGWLAVGDAAIALDPLSGQGVNHALRSALRAASAIRRYLDGKDDALNDYARTCGDINADYLRARARHYASERRWPGSAFWARRVVRRDDKEFTVAKGFKG